MKAIRPIYDGKDDLDFREEMDAVDMTVCLFSELNDRIDSMDDIIDEQRSMIKELAGNELIPPGVIIADKGINDDMCDPEYDDGFDELIVMYEIKRWLEESGYDWSITPDSRYRYHSFLLGLMEENDSVNDSGIFILNTSEKAFAELKKLLRFHWAVELLDWYPVTINGVENNEMIQFGNIVISK